MPATDGHTQKESRQCSLPRGVPFIQGKGKGEDRVCNVSGKGRGERAEPLPVKSAIDSVANSGSSRCGDVSLLWALSVDLGIPEILDRYCSDNLSTSSPSRREMAVFLIVSGRRHFFPHSISQPTGRWSPHPSRGPLKRGSPDCFSSLLIISESEAIPIPVCQGCGVIQI